MTKYLSAFLIFVGMFLFGKLLAQSEYTVKSKRAVKSYQMAVDKFNQHFYTEALVLIDEALEIDSMFIEAYLLKADLYKSTNKPSKEVECFEKVVSINPDFFIYTYYNLGEALYFNGEYKRSKENLNLFLDKNAGYKTVISKANKLLVRCDQAIEIKANPVDFLPINLGDGINNDFEQYWPSLSLDGNTMIYTVLLPDSSRISMLGDFAKQEDFYISLRDHSGWGHGEPIGAPLNTPGNEGAHKLSADGKTIVFTGCNRSDGFGNCDIYFSYKSNGKWSVPENAGRAINTLYSEKQPSLSPDGRFLYFSTNRVGGIGGMDLWYSENMNGYWSQPVNMGEAINTKGDEVSPFIHPDNSTFYFSSSGHPGLGMKDIFYTRKDSLNNWTNAANIGYPINSHRDEIGLVVDASGEKAYYATNINSESTNIYEFLMPPKAKPNSVSYVTGIIYDAETEEPLDGKFQLANLNTNDTIMQASSNPQDGKYLVCLPSGQNYGFNVQHTGYLFYSVNFNLEGEHSLIEPFELNIPMTRIKTGSKVVLDNVFFETDSYELKDYSESELEKVFEFVKNNQNLQIEISGHTDNVGDKLYNVNLSEKRAQSVYNYLIAKGIPMEQLSFKGYGQNQPIVSNENAKGRAKNRRTELLIIGQDEN